MSQSDTNGIDNSSEIVPALGSTATDIFSLGQQVDGFEWRQYQDIQNDQAMYDSFQRWPFLFAVAMAQRYRD